MSPLPSPFQLQLSSDDVADRDRQENKERFKQFNDHRDHHQQISYSKTAFSPTLAELNAISEGPKTKHANTSSTYLSPYSPSPPPPPISTTHLSSNSVSDSCSSLGLLPRMAFNDKESFDDLSSSFRALYKSIFGSSITQGDYFNDSMTGNGKCGVVPGITSSSCSGSLPPSALLNSVNNPQFASLMGSFRDIAETNSWDKLDPAQIQGLVDSFKAGEHDKFGLEPEVYADLYASFNHFLSQLNNRFLTGSSNLSPQLSEYSRQHPHPASRSVPHNLIGGGLAHKYHQHHKLDTDLMSPLLINLHRQGSSTPTNFNPNSNRTPSPGLRHSPQDQLAVLALGSVPNLIHQPQPHNYGGYVNTVNPTTAPLADQDSMTVRFAPTDLFDDDDFDWSKLM